MNRTLLISLIVIIVVAAIGYYALESPKTATENLTVTNFEECANAGYPVMESYPRQCRTPSGELFVESIANPNPTAPVSGGQTGATAGCFVGGCSGQICSSNKDVITTCEYREEYACYKSAKCERQSNGQCGWTDTPELSACLISGANSNVYLK